MTNRLEFHIRKFFVEHGQALFRIILVDEHLAELHRGRDREARGTQVKRIGIGTENSVKNGHQNRTHPGRHKHSCERVPVD